MWKYIRDFIFPLRCPRCHAVTDWGRAWCDDCLAVELHPRYVEVEDMDYLSTVFVLGDYDGGLRHIIQNIKFNHKKGQVDGLVPFLQEMVSAVDWSHYDYVVPIPISDGHAKERGYNQVDIIFQESIARISHVQYVNVLEKSNDTKAMWTLDREERKQNMAHAFSIRKEGCDIRGKSILLVDDILTTGSTLSAARKVLLDGGAMSVEALVLASGAHMKAI